MEFIVGLSLLLALLIVGGGVLLVLRRRRGQARVRRSADMAALDERISERIAILREGKSATELPELPSGAGGPDDAAPLPALLPVERGTSLARRLGLGGGEEPEGERRSRRTVARDAAIVLGVAVVFLLVASQLIPAAPSPPNQTASPTPTHVAVLPSGTPNLLRPTPTATGTPSPTGTPDITFEPTPTPEPTPSPTPYVAPTPVPGGGGGGGGGTPVPTPIPDTSPPTKPGGFGIQSVTTTSVTLDWQASVDNKGVVGYKLYRDGVFRKNVFALSTTDSPLTPGASYTFGLRAYDAAGNLSIAAIQVVTTLSPTPTPCVPASVTISPASSAITAGGSQAYTATNNCGTDVTGSTTFSILPDGACGLTSCSATNDGAHTVTAMYSVFQDTASLTVNAGALDHITISCSPTSVAAGVATNCSGTAFDVYGNSLGDVTGSTIWTISPDGSCDSAGACTPALAGPHTVMGDYSSKTDSFPVTAT